MATKHMLPDVATVFVPLGEDEEGVQQWTAYLFSTVSCRPSAGTSRNATGNNAEADNITLYIFDNTSRVSGGGTIAATCESIFGVIRDVATITDDDTRIYVVPYDASGESEPPPRSRLVDSVTRFKAGSSRMWHWKVVAR